MSHTDFCLRVPTFSVATLSQRNFFKNFNQASPSTTVLSRINECFPGFFRLATPTFLSYLCIAIKNRFPPSNLAPNPARMAGVAIKNAMTPKMRRYK